MHRLLLPLVAILLILSLCQAVAAENRLAPLEATVIPTERLQPGLESFSTVVQTERIAATIQAMTASIPADLPRPPVPKVVKYWRRGAAGSLVVAEGAQTQPFMQQMVQRISAGLTIEPEYLLLPASQAAERQRLTSAATVKTAEIKLDDTVLQRLQISFPAPTELGEAFYGTGLRLLHKGVVLLQFDIDTRTRTVRELLIQTDSGEQLQAELRYRQAPGGFMPERVRVTSPDGKVDDLLEITFGEISGFVLPQKALRVLQRPELQDRLEVTFTDYRLNQTLPAEIEAQLADPARTARPHP